MATRLLLYNLALLALGERALESLTVNEEPRHLLDTVWNNNGVDSCLEEGQWEFAMRTMRIDYDPGIEPDYGYTRAFDKPTDWMLTSAVCSDEYFSAPLNRYVDEAAFWYCDLESIYVRYVSNDDSYGGDLSKWPQSFTDFVAADFATKIVMKITSDPARLELFVNLSKPRNSIRGRALLKAKSRCAMSGPMTFPAPGNWSTARARGVRGDRGNTSGDLY